MSHYITEQDDISFFEPVLAQKNVRVKVGFAEKVQWEAKTKGEKNGDFYDACKLTLEIDDSTVRTEHADAKPRLTIEDQFNIQQFPYEDKKTGEIKKLGKKKLYQLEAALGFDPVFLVNGQRVEPFVTKTGNKVAPKIDGVKRMVNPDFFEAYFTAEGAPRMDNWSGKILYANIGVEESEKFGNRNNIDGYVKAPVV